MKSLIWCLLPVAGLAVACGDGGPASQPSDLGYESPSSDVDAALYQPVSAGPQGEMTSPDGSAVVSTPSPGGGGGGGNSNRECREFCELAGDDTEECVESCNEVCAQSDRCAQCICDNLDAPLELESLCSDACVDTGPQPTECASGDVCADCLCATDGDTVTCSSLCGA